MHRYLKHTKFTACEHACVLLLLRTTDGLGETNRSRGALSYSENYRLIDDIYRETRIFFTNIEDLRWRH